MENAFTIAAYVVAAVLFILGLKGLTHPRRAVRGNLLGSTGMGSFQLSAGTEPYAGRVAEPGEAPRRLGWPAAREGPRRRRCRAAGA